MTGYDAELRGFEEQIRKFDQEDEIVRSRLMRAMSDSVKAVARITKNTAPGTLGAGIDHEVMATPDEGIVGRVLSREFFARFVEFGTAKHGVSSDVIAEQMGVDRDSAFMIARSIARKGTRGRHFMFRAFKSAERGIKSFFDRAVKRITEDLGNQ